MKFLVSASDAQSGVVSGSKEMGAICKGMQAMTLAPWRPFSILIEVEETYRFVPICANHSVACLAWNRQINGPDFGDQGPMEEIIAI